MGLSLEFHLGDAAAIEDAVAEGKWKRLRDPGVVTHFADFSLHITPRDLDMLSEAIGEATHQEPMPLRPSLKPIVDAKTQGALLVGRDWVRYAASIQQFQSIQPDVVSEIAESWASAMRNHYGAEIKVTDAMRTAIKKLGELCQAAVETGGEVVHVWHL